MDYVAAIQSYYRGFRDKDLALLQSLLASDFHFVSSFGEYRERDSMLEEIWPSVGQAWATNLRIFGDGPEFVVVYEHENAPGVQRAPMRMAEYIRFRGEQIARVEVFVGRSLEPARDLGDVPG